MARMILKEPAAKSDADHSLRFIIYAIAVTDEEWNAFESRFQVRSLRFMGHDRNPGSNHHQSP